MKKYKVLIVEDDYRTAILFKNVLKSGDFDVDIAQNGNSALKLMGSTNYDVMITDWMMPVMDGIEMMRLIENGALNHRPYIIMLTSIMSADAKNYAVESGVNLFLQKPLNLDELVQVVKDGAAILNDKSNTKIQPLVNKAIETLPPFAACAIAASTGGPKDLMILLKQCECFPKAAYFLVQHGPAWMLETFAERISNETTYKAKISEDGEKIKPGVLYIAAGDKHTVVSDKGFTLSLNMQAKENYVRPAADPLFRSVANNFGMYAVGVVLTGLGKDAMYGAKYIEQAGGKILVQDPKTCVAPSMPSSVIEYGIKSEVGTLQEIAKRLPALLNMNELRLQKNR